MSRITPNLGLYVPAQNEHYGTHMDDNLDIIDTIGNGGEFGGWDGYLASPIVAGDRTFTLTAAPPSLFNAREAVVVIDPGINGEARELKSLSGSTFTINSDGDAFKVAHASGARVKWIVNRQLNPFLFGAKADRGVSDDWRPAQRTVLECSKSGCVYTGGQTLFIQEPVYIGQFNANGFYLRADDSTWRPTKQPGVMCMAKSARASIAVSGAASNNRLTFTDGQTPGGLGITAGKKIAFNNPYFETLPTGIQSGRIYLVKTVGADYVTISEITTPTVELDITVNGTAMAYSNMSSLVKTNINGLQFHVYISDVGGISVTPEQLSGNYNWFFDTFHTATTARTVILCDVGYTEGGGQQANFFNMAFTCNDKIVGLAVGGTGYYFGGVMPLVNATGPAIICQGAQLTFESPWIESCHEAGIVLVSTCDGIRIGNMLHSSPQATYMVVDETDVGAGFTLGQIKNAQAASKQIKGPAANGGYDLTSWDGTGSHHNAIGDRRGTTGPYESSAGTGLSFGPSALSGGFVWRTSNDGTSLTPSLYYKSYRVDTTGGALAVNLVNLPGVSYRPYFQRIAGSNAVTITPAGGATIQNDAGAQVSAVSLTDSTPRAWRYEGQVIGGWVRD